MFKLHDSSPWMLLAIATGALSLFRLSAGDTPLLAMIVCVVAGVCALHGRIRGTVARGLLRVFSGSIVRSLAIIFGAMMLIQLLPLELALLMAGDILVYLEAVAAVTLIAANTRLKPLAAARRARSETGLLTARDRLRRSSRQPRAQRPARRPSRFDDPDGQVWAFA